MKTHRFTATVTSRIACSTSLVCSLGALLPACVDAEPRDLGFTQSSDDLSVNPPREPFTSATDEFVGRWVGSAEETLVLSEDGVTTTYEFPSGSTRIEVELTRDTSGSLSGRIVFGNGQPPPPPTDPGAAYPEGLDYETLLGYEYQDSFGGESNAIDFRFSNLPPFEGFEYEINQAGYTINESDDELLVPDGIVVLGFNTFEPLAPWCELQTPQANPEGNYSCAPDLGGSYTRLADGTGASCQIQANTSHCFDLLPEPCGLDCDYTEFDACSAAVPVETVNCDQLFMCRTGFCECTESGCTAPPSTGDRLQVRRVGDELIGLFGTTIFKNARGLSVPLGEVRLRLAQPQPQPQP